MDLHIVRSQSLADWVLLQTEGSEQINKSYFSQNLRKAAPRPRIPLPC